MAVLTEEQEMLRNMAREWTDNENPISEYRKVRASGDPKRYAASAHRAMAEMGWTGIIVQEKHGGSDFGWLSAGLVVGELGRTLTATPLVASTLAASAIILGGSEEQKTKYLPALANGEMSGTLAMDEGTRHDPSKFMKRVSDGKTFGTKSFVHEAHSADLFIVAASDGVYLVDKGDDIAQADRHLTDQRSHAQVIFDGAKADKLDAAADLLLDDLLDRARILAGCEMLGMAQTAFDMTLDYLKQRVQFNQILATF